MKNNFLKFPIVLALVGLICGGALSVVYEIANPIIVERAKAETKAALSEVVSNLKTYNDVEGNEEGMAATGVTEIFELIDSSDATLGYAYKVTSYGKNEMSSLVAINKAGDKVLGFKVLSQNETVGIGDKALASKDYMAKFVGINPASADGIDNFSGATLTSGGLRDAITAAHNYQSSYLK